MKKFNIEIQEFLSRTIEIEAENTQDAILKVKKCIITQKLYWIQAIM